MAIATKMALELELELQVLENLKSNEKCIFCRHNAIDELRYGKMYKYGEIITHYFCMLFSSNMEQNGSDDEGILGFLPQDIKKETWRGNRLQCCYCHHAGATIGCSVKACKKKFHYPCGIQNGSLHLFFGQFKSFCYAHRTNQTVPQNACKLTEKSTCVMCLSDVDAKPTLKTIWAPCCKQTWLHKNCVQKMAITAGYFFKCPNCNNKDIFRTEMLECGIYIPDQDAAWELEPNAFNELTERHNACDSIDCKCPRGRNFAVQGCDWEIILCNFCGSQGIHKKCGANVIDGKGNWVCPLCSPIAKSAVKETTSIAEEDPGPSHVPRKQAHVIQPTLNLRKDNARSRKANRRKRSLSLSADDSDGTPAKISVPAISNVNAENVTESREITDIVCLDSDDDDDDDGDGSGNGSGDGNGQTRENSDARSNLNDDIEAQLTKLGLANTVRSGRRKKNSIGSSNRNAATANPSIVINLLEDSSDEETEHFPRISNATRNSERLRELLRNFRDEDENGNGNGDSRVSKNDDDDDDVIFVGCDSSQKDDSSATFIRLMDNDRIVLTTPQAIKRNGDFAASSLTTTNTTCSSACDSTNNSAAAATSRLHSEPNLTITAVNTVGLQNVWHPVPPDKSMVNNFTLPQITSTISLSGNYSTINQFFNDNQQQPNTTESSNLSDGNIPFTELVLISEETVPKDITQSVRSWNDDLPEIINLD